MVNEITHRASYLLLTWNSALAAFMFVIIEPMFPTIVAKMRTPMRKSMVTKRYSKSCTG